MPPAEGSSAETKSTKVKKTGKTSSKEAKPRAAAATTADSKLAAAKKSAKSTKKLTKSSSNKELTATGSGTRGAKTEADKAAPPLPANATNGAAAEETPPAGAAAEKAATSTGSQGGGSATRPSHGRRSSSRGPLGLRQKSSLTAGETNRGRRLLSSKKTQVDVDKIIRAEDREDAKHNDKAVEVKLDPRGQIGISFYGVHISGMEAIRVREVNKEVHGEKVKVEDELFAIDGEQLHGGLAHPQITEMLEAKMLAKRASGFAVRLSLRRRTGYSHMSGDLGNFMHHLGKEYAAGQPDVRPFVYSIDQGLLGMAKSNLDANRIDLTDELAVLKHKTEFMTAEDVGQPAIATTLMRLARKAAFMKRMVELQKRRRQIQAVISAFMQEPLHGPQRQRERLAKQAELVQIENEMKQLCEARVAQLTAYSSYDCRSSLIKLNAQKAQLLNEKATLEKSLNRKHTMEDRDSVQKDIAHLKQLEAHAQRTMREFKDNIYVKEIELDGILAEWEQEHFGVQIEDGGAEFPSKSTYWNSKKQARA